MKRTLSHTASIIGLALGLTASTAFSQTTANGPYTPRRRGIRRCRRTRASSCCRTSTARPCWTARPDWCGRRRPTDLPEDWLNQSIHCVNLNKGGRAGWRLPTVQELLSSWTGHSLTRRCPAATLLPCLRPCLGIGRRLASPLLRRSSTAGVVREVQRLATRAPPLKHRRVNPRLVCARRPGC